MTQPSFNAPSTPPNQLIAGLRGQAFAVLEPQSLYALMAQRAAIAEPPAALAALQAGWLDLPPDAHLKDGGRYRRRRHVCYVLDSEGLRATKPRAHWQPLEYNALHGGMARWFEPVLPQVAEQPGWQALLVALGRVFSETLELQPAPTWFIEAHQFRIDTTDGIGRPTPEGAHRDGVDFVAVILIGRHAIKGGETRVFEADGPSGQRFTLTEPWSALLLDDARVIHESTPIQPLVAGGSGWRDTLVVTYRRGGFQGPFASA
jgi:hypothetical protein